jgi:hypothetical protein
MATHDASAAPLDVVSQNDVRRCHRRWMGQGPGHRGFDFAVAVALFIATMALLLATDQMGFARDEAFYFAHAEAYQNWQVEVEAGGERRTQALERETLLRTWRENAEHPPLDKVLFGWSWRLFGRKLREINGFQSSAGLSQAADIPAQAVAPDTGAVQADLRGLGPAQGFEVGADVWLLSPQLVDSDPDPTPRRIGHGVVRTRTPFAAMIAFTDHPGLPALDALCRPAGTTVDADVLRTGCEVVEDRPLALLSESAAMRAPGMFFAALLVMLIWLFARGFGSGVPLLARPFALLAAVGYLAIPRAFFHAHLACFDMTITTLLVATTLAYHHALRHRSFVWVTAVLWGFSLLAKHNALVLPVAFICHWLWDGLAEGRISLFTASRATVGQTTGALRNPPVVLGVGVVFGAVLAALVAPVVGLAMVGLTLAGAGVRLRLPPLPLAWFVMLPVGFAMLIAGWPLLWVDTAQHFMAWIEFHLHHEHYMQTYFGAVLAYPPFPVAMPWVLTVLTWPPSLLVGFAIGAFVLTYAGLQRLPTSVAAAVGGVRFGDRRGGPPDLVQRDDPSVHTRRAEQRSLDRLLILTAIWPIFLISLPSTPVFGGTKHWMTAYPAMLLIAARGLQWAWFAVTERWRDAHWPLRARAALLAWAMIAASLLPAVLATAEHHPHGTTYYNELIGGVQGAAVAGLQRQFWGYQTRAGLAEVNRRAPQRARIWFHKCAWGAFMMYAREGWLRRDLHYSGNPEGTALGFFHHQYDHDDYELEIMADYGVAAPVAQQSLQGVPLLSVYERPKVRSPRPIRGDRGSVDAR